MFSEKSYNHLVEPTNFGIWAYQKPEMKSNSLLSLSQSVTEAYQQTLGKINKKGNQPMGIRYSKLSESTSRAIGNIFIKFIIIDKFSLSVVYSLMESGYRFVCSDWLVRSIVKRWPNDYRLLVSTSIHRFSERDLFVYCQNEILDMFFATVTLVEIACHPYRKCLIKIS